jgi:hypothetical protein
VKIFSPFGRVIEYLEKIRKSSSEVREGISNQSALLNDRLRELIAGIDNEQRILNDKLGELIQNFNSFYADYNSHQSEIKQYLSEIANPSKQITKNDRPKSSQNEKLRSGSKIFVLSLHRCATQSTHDLFLRAGVDAIHWPVVVGDVDCETQVIGRELDSDFIVDILAPVIASATAFSDVPFPTIYESLAKKYSDARFLAISRSPFDWVRSVRRHVGGRSLYPYEKVQYWRYLKDKPESLVDVTDDDLVLMFVEHYVELHKFFSNKRNFKLFNLEDPELGHNICDFLEMQPLSFGNVDESINAGR